MTGRSIPLVLYCSLEVNELIIVPCDTVPLQVFAAVYEDPLLRRNAFPTRRMELTFESPENPTEDLSTQGIDTDLSTQGIDTDLSTQGNSVTRASIEKICFNECVRVIEFILWPTIAGNDALGLCRTLQRTAAHRNSWLYLTKSC